jgi:hypothetical protein
MINKNFFLWKIVKPEENFYFKYLLLFSYDFNLPFNFFKDFDLKGNGTGVFL